MKYHGVQMFSQISRIPDLIQKFEQKGAAYTPVFTVIYLLIHIHMHMHMYMQENISHNYHTIITIPLPTSLKTRLPKQDHVESSGCP